MNYDIQAFRRCLFPEQHFGLGDITLVAIAAVGIALSAGHRAKIIPIDCFDSARIIHVADCVFLNTYPDLYEPGIDTERTHKFKSNR